MSCGIRLGVQQDFGKRQVAVGNYMKFSAQEEYGLRCLLRVASAGEGGSVTIPAIAKAEALSIAIRRQIDERPSTK